MILIFIYATLLSIIHPMSVTEPLARRLVKLETTGSDCLDQWWSDHNLDRNLYLKKSLPVDNWYVVEIPESDLVSLEHLSCVSKVMEDQRIVWRNTVPNDPVYINQGDMNLIGMPQAWDITTGGLTSRGDTIVVAVVDDGFDIQHQDLVANVWKNKGEIPGDLIDNDNDGYIDDYKGLNVLTGDDAHPKKKHGTQVAGIIGAKGNNSIGVTGVNWNVKLMLISGVDFESEVIEAYQYALDMRKKYNDTHGSEGAFVVATNLSGGINNAFAADHPMWCDMYDKMGAQGILSVTAGPNQSISVDVDGDMPTTCTSPYMIAVTNVDLTDVLMSSAGFGINSIDIGAPGEGTLTVDLNNEYHGFNGTSAAAPHVTGTVGLMYASPCTSFLSDLDSDPDGLALRIKDIILSTAKKNNSLEGITVTGKRLQVDAALKATVTDCHQPVEAGIKITSITPNPAGFELARIKFITGSDSLNMSIDVYTDAGARVKSIQLTPEEVHQGFYDIDTRPLAAAIYLVTIRNSKEKYTAKLIVGQ